MIQTRTCVTHRPCVHVLIEIKFNQEWELVAPPPYEQVVALQQSEEPVQDKSTPPQQDAHSIEQDTTPIRVVEFTSLSEARV